jgi:hypothetical protein
MKEEIMNEIGRVAIILTIAMFGFTMVTVFALCTKIDKLETKIERLK